MNSVNEDQIPSKFNAIGEMDKLPIDELNKLNEDISKNKNDNNFAKVNSKKIRKLLKQADTQILTNHQEPIIVEKNAYKEFAENDDKNKKSKDSVFLKKRDINDSEVLKKFIHDANNLQIIRNKHLINDLLLSEAKMNSFNQKTKNKTDKFVPPKFFVILIQVHSRIIYLKELIESLRNTKSIQDALVIFSHDVYIKEMNDLIDSIEFCATMQIFYPYSLQVYKNTFPGMEPNDCGKSLSKAEAIKVNCNNRFYPDQYGHYREEKIVQIKHHWFWKISYVFERLKVTKNLENLQILLLEEDHYLMPDSIYMLRKLSEKILSDIDVVSLAHIDKLVQDLKFDKIDMYAKAIWHTSHHNTGLMLGRVQWRMLKDCSNAFCTYDDYNWDWTLQHMSQNCFKLPLVSIYPSSSRVIHIGQCGTHYKGKNCDPKQSVENLKMTQKQKSHLFFPEKIRFEKVDTAIHSAKKSNGGWSDPRDHQLCKSFLTSNSNSLNLVNITISI